MDSQISIEIEGSQRSSKRPKNCTSIDPVNGKFNYEEDYDLTDKESFAVAKLELWKVFPAQLSSNTLSTNPNYIKYVQIQALNGSKDSRLLDLQGRKDIDMSKLETLKVAVEYAERARLEMLQLAELTSALKRNRVLTTLTRFPDADVDDSVSATNSAMRSTPMYPNIPLAQRIYIQRSYYTVSRERLSHGYKEALELIKSRQQLGQQLTAFTAQNRYPLVLIDKFTNKTVKYRQFDSKRDIVAVNCSIDTSNFDNSATSTAAHTDGCYVPLVIHGSTLTTVSSAPTDSRMNRLILSLYVVSLKERALRQPIRIASAVSSPVNVSESDRNDPLTLYCRNKLHESLVRIVYSVISNEVKSLVQCWDLLGNGNIYGDNAAAQQWNTQSTPTRTSYELYDEVVNTVMPERFYRRLVVAEFNKDMCSIKLSDSLLLRIEISSENVSETVESGHEFEFFLRELLQRSLLSVILYHMNGTHSKSLDSFVNGFQTERESEERRSKNSVEVQDLIVNNMVNPLRLTVNGQGQPNNELHTSSIQLLQYSIRSAIQKSKFTVSTD